MTSKVSTPVVEMPATDGGPLPANRFKVVKIDQRLPGKTGLKGEDPVPVTYKRGRWTVTDFYDGPSCTPCNSSPTTPSPLATFAGPRITNPGGQVDGSIVTSPPIISGANTQVHPLVSAAMDPSQPPDELKLSSENSSLMANRGIENQSDVVPCISANPPGLLSPEDRKTSLPNIPGALILQSPAGRLARKTSLHDSHKIGGFTVEPVLDPSDPIAPVTGQVPPTNPTVTAVAENSSSSSSSSSTADASSNTASPSTSDATPMVTVVQAHPSTTNCNSTAVNPSNNNAATVNASAAATHNPVNVLPKPVAAAPVLAAAAASVNVTAKLPIAPTVISDVTKTFSVTTVPENADVTEAASNVSASHQVNNPEAQQQGAAANQQPKETPMEVSASPESTVTAAEGAALTAAIEAVAATSAGINTTTSPSDVAKVNVGGQTDHVAFIDESLAGTASNSIASTAPQSVSIPLVSSVAIDNKIEQAMDLVKSHLMFAVREEVDVLKEKIVELLERIQLLETENAILKQAHQNQLGNQGTQSLVTGIQLNTSPVPAVLDMDMSSVGTSTDAVITSTQGVTTDQGSGTAPPVGVTTSVEQK